MFGLMSTASFAENKAQNSRRRVFYEYPNGAATLTGLLSLMDVQETSQPEFSWFEDRFQNQRTTTADIGTGKGAFSPGGGDTGYTAAGFSLAQDDIVRVRTAALGTNVLRTTNVVRVSKVPQVGGTTTKSVVGVITAIIATNKFEMRVVEAYTNLLNGDGTGGTTDIANLAINVIGTANPEGARSTKGFWLPPKKLSNYTQIFRSAFTFTRTALKGTVEFDKTGLYRHAAKKTSQNHMIELEKAFLFGRKSDYVATAHDGEEVPEKTTGGVLHFLEQWELGTPYGNSTTAITDMEDPAKRLIDLGGSMGIDRVNRLMSNLFTVTNNQEWCKLGLCGSGYLANMNRLFEGQIQKVSGEEQKNTFYGMKVVQHSTIDGDVYYKTHPLFNIDPDLKYSCLYLDIPNLEYRPLLDSDTTLLKNRQENDEDRRKDEWITEAGLELHKPESHMFVEGFNDID